MLGRYQTLFLFNHYTTISINELYESDPFAQGLNSRGQLGIESTSNLYAPQATPIDLGDGFNAVKLNCGSSHCCAVCLVSSSCTSLVHILEGATSTIQVSVDGYMKCWGDCGYGECGYGDTISRGMVSGDMGDNLPIVDLVRFELELITFSMMLTRCVTCQFSMHRELELL